MKTPIAEGIRGYSITFKPHMVLEGQTPAKKAGIGIEGSNKWLEILRKIRTKS